MIVNLGKSNVYSIGNFVKSTAGNLVIDGAINCNGNISISLGANSIGDQSYTGDYSISCKGNVTLSDGRSNQNIYYSGVANIATSWDRNQYEVIPFKALPGFIETSDLAGYLQYLISMTPNGVSTYSAGTYTLKGNYTKSINVFNLLLTEIQNSTSLVLSTKAASSSLVKVNANGQVATLTGLNMTMNCSASDVIFAIDSTTLNINNCNIKGTIFAPNSDVVLNNSTIDGAIYAKSITVTGNVTIHNSPFNGYIEQPVAPVIKIAPLSSIDNYEAIEVSVYSESGNIPAFYEIRYTLNGKEPTRESTLYVGSFDLYEVGVTTVKAKIFGNGVSDGGIASQAYGFKCKVSTPYLVKTVNQVSGLTEYSISHDIGSTVYYTLDGSDPSVFASVYDESTFNSQFSEEGAYNLRFFAYSPSCDNSDIVDEYILIELPDIGLQPPVIEVWRTLNGAKVSLVHTVPSTPLKSDIVVPGSFSYADVDSFAVYMRKTNPSDASKVRYTIDGSNPVEGIAYTYETPIYLKAITNNRLRVFSHIDFKEFSPQRNHLLIVSTTDSKTFDTTWNVDRSEEVLDALQGGSSYAIDMAWVGPGVVTDDFAVYQALINILATEMFERIFNPSFGVSITARLAEINADLNSESIISDLKAEVEAQDPRIRIRADMSLAYFDESIGALVVDLMWTNLVTNNSATLKYAYDLDTVL